ncbi:MAG TPA: alpha/beta hydrolase [Candidatus Limnocylindria bacterium]|nr:alpha/beta hydrolase [Candidatus Limnocylindria bacterium]
MPIEHRYVSVRGLTLHCAVAGDGPLLVLLHGFPECWYSWRHQLDALASRFRVVAPDLRGYNESDKPPGVRAYELGELVADVEALIEAFGASEAGIVGHDWGGGIAWTFAMERPQRTRRLAVLNCPHPAIFAQALRRDPRQLLKSWYMFFFQIPWLPETLLALGHAAAVGRAFRDSTVVKGAITEDDLRVLRDAASRPGALRAGINYYRAVFRQQARADAPAWLKTLAGWTNEPPSRRTLADWPRITAPTLLIWGEQDVALRKELTYGMEPLFQAPFRVHYVPESGHWVQQEQPALVNQLLLEHFG